MHVPTLLLPGSYLLVNHTGATDSPPPSYLRCSSRVLVKDGRPESPFLKSKPISVGSSPHGIGSLSSKVLFPSRSCILCDGVFFVAGSAGPETGSGDNLHGILVVITERGLISLH